MYWHRRQLHVQMQQWYMIHITRFARYRPLCNETVYIILWFYFAGVRIVILSVSPVIESVSPTPTSLYCLYIAPLISYIHIISYSLLQVSVEMVRFVSMYWSAQTLRWMTALKTPTALNKSAHICVNVTLASQEMGPRAPISMSVWQTHHATPMPPAKTLNPHIGG